MASVYEIVQGLSQAAANAYDGALDESGEPIKAGLQREEGDPILDKRVMDGFNVRFYGNMMCLSYMSEVHLKEVYASGFESDIEQRMADITAFLKKEYRKIRGESVALTKEGEIDVYVESSSRVRSWVTAKLHYRVGGLDEAMAVAPEGVDTQPEASFQKFIDQGGWTGDGGKRPQNDTRPKPSND
tara:strand:- start:1862 stop:2419 length:558 start_codon:yes stop_codon:yes gene_type:complete